MADPRDRYDPDLQKGVDWALIPIIILPSVVLCAVIWMFFFA